jgi:hypothetical protein
MIKRLNNILALVLLSFLSFAIYSQGPVYAQVSSKKVQVGVPFEYAIVITTNASNYAPPVFKDFDVVSGPHQSSSTQIINGVVSQQVVLSWGLAAKKEGKLTITSAVVNAGSAKYETLPITIEAVKGSSSQGQAQSNQDLNNGVNINDGEIFIKTVPTKTKLYVGEQLTVTHKLFSRNVLVGMKKYEAPVFDGFWSKKIDVPGQAIQETIDGVVYITLEMEKHLLYANSSGKKIIKSVEPIWVVRKITNKKPRNIIEQFFGTQQYEDIETRAKSNSLAIEVLPLPEQGKPNNFNGAVGKFNYKVEASKQSLKANDAFNLKITLSGNGNFPLLDAPKFQLPEEFEVYDPKISESANSKSFDYLIIPRSEGEFILKELDFSYFSPETKKYITLTAPEIKINVLPTDQETNGAQVYTPQNNIKETENDIRYIKKGNFKLIKSDSEFFNSTAHLTTIAISLLSLSGALLARRKYIQANSDVTVVKQRKAARIARKQLRQAEQMMKQNNKDAFYTEILLALNNYLGYKLNIPAADLSRDNIQKILTAKHVNGDFILKTLKTIETGEFAKYAPGAVSGDLKAVYSDTAELITMLEGQLNKKTNT